MLLAHHQTPINNTVKISESVSLEDTIKAVELSLGDYLKNALEILKNVQDFAGARPE